jgi:hypothetical protein
MKVADEPAEVVEEIVHVWREANATFCLVAEGLLEQAEEATETRDCHDHATELADNLLPASCGDPGL